ncbi:hypothetical protein BC938DRAFT_481810 [Jimgerdemannia flammicorona]|uniref:DIS3-like exonuclease 2 n=1 Tax=Jimgerdemannia flammicorona TaxID=994334 RepID=A0A433QFC1_9FUNG|nr:hypothetical protein BC938DRAFT_481810 [Jimgerdemannia flammicorona]
MDLLEQQTAPESTRGLFDPPETKPIPPAKNNNGTKAKGSNAEKRKSVQLSEPKKPDEIATLDYDPTAKNKRGHQRSKSAITPEMLAQQNRRSTPQMQSLTEENSFVDNQEVARDDGAGRSADQVKRTSNKEKRQSRNMGKPQEASSSGVEPKSDALSSLQEMISTLKSLPPIQPSKPQDGKFRENGNGEASSPDKLDDAARKTHRKQQSMSAISIPKAASDNMSVPDVEAALQSTVAELRSLSEKEKKDKKKRRESISEGVDKKGKLKQAEGDDAVSSQSRAEALAEAEAKLTGTYRRDSIDYDDNSDEGKRDRRRSNQQDGARRNRRLSEPSARPNFGDQQQSAGEKEKQRRSSMLVQSSAETSLSDKNGSAQANSQKRVSLQLRQLPTLSEAAEDSQAGPTTPKGSKRPTFNKPLTLVQEGDKSLPKGQNNRRSSRNFEFDWRSTASPLSPHQIPLSPNAPAFSPRTNKFNHVPFTPTRVNFARDDANPNQRRPLFTAHLPFSALTPLLKSRQLIRGTLRINKRNRSDAYVTSEDLDADIYICGSRDRNRALEGDVVAVKLVDVDKVLREKKEKEEAKIARNGGQPRVRKPDDEDDNEIVLGGDEDVEKVKPKYCGVIVAVLERAQGQLFSGTLTLLRPNNKRALEEKAADEAKKTEGEDENSNKKENPRIVWFKPTDKRVPLIAIPIEQAPEGFVQKHEDYTERLFVGSIKRWPITSLHPFGTLERELGLVGNIDNETQALLADNNVHDVEFADAVLKCLPLLPWSIPEKEYITRRDLRTSRIFSIDPATAKDLDDALSITELSDGTYEVGVHIADVSYFIKAHAALDKEARSRGTSVYLVQKVVPMLPSLLCEELCSLNPGVERLAFSVIWKLSAEAKVLDTWFGRSIIQSCSKLSYDAAQSVIDGNGLPEDIVFYGQEKSDVEKDIKMLYELSKQLRDARFKNGALSMNSVKLSFELDSEGQPINVSVSEKKESNRLVEEYMLLANISVANKISAHFPEQALLRRHAPPIERRLADFLKLTEKLGYNFDGSSAGALNVSFEGVESSEVREVLKLLAVKPMQRSKYFCTGTLDIMKYLHYALNVPLYTHFTSPIRRYADVIVHRQLEAVLSGEKRFYLDRDTVQKTAQHCNVKKDGAKSAQEQSSHLFLAQYLSNIALKSGPIVRDGVVVAVLDTAFDVSVPEYGIEKRIHLDGLPLEASKLNEQTETLHLFWKKGVAVTELLVEKKKDIADDYVDDEEVGDLDEDALLEEMKVADTQQPEPIEPATPAALDPEEAIVSQLADSVRRLAVESSSKFEEETAFEAQVDDMTSEQFTEMHQVNVFDTTTQALRAVTPVRVAPVDDNEPIGPNVQTIRVFSRLRIVINVDITKSPPIIKVLAANPFM